jgi:Rrf2 family transcriptional regulator, iron-sulfur cluster assembly transcription factor
MRLELTRRGDYAVRAMLAIATAKPGNGPLSARRISEQMSVPARFLPHVLRDLVRAGLVEGQTGRGGGYRLARDPSEITLLAVINAVEGDQITPACVLRGIPCRSDGTCAVHDVFDGARKSLLQRLAATSLADVPFTVD